MKILSRTEEIILATVWKLQGNAYGVTINEYIRKNTGLNWKFGSIYTPLGRLARKGYVKTLKGAPSPERGGRRKIYFELTEKGKEALLVIQKVNSAIWIDMPVLKPK